MDGWIGWYLGGVRYRAPYSANNNTQWAAPTPPTGYVKQGLPPSLNQKCQTISCPKTRTLSNSNFVGKFSQATELPEERGEPSDATSKQKPGDL